MGKGALREGGSGCARVCGLVWENLYLWPGANRSTQGPKLEKEARAFEMVDAPTVMAVGKGEGARGPKVVMRCGGEGVDKGVAGNGMRTPPCMCCACA